MSSRLVQHYRSNQLNVRSNPNDGAYSLFGSIGGGRRIPIPTSKSFIPTDGEGGVLDLKGTNVNPQWLGLESKMMQYWAYAYCSPLAAVIDRIAEADSNGRIFFVDQNQATVKNVNKKPNLLRVKRLFAKPNPLQTWEEFDSEQVVLSKIYGYCPVFAIGGTSSDRTLTKYLFNLDPQMGTPIANDRFSIYGATSPQQIVDGVSQNPIKEWQFNINGETVHIKSENIILIKDGFMCHYNELGLPLSKISGLDYSVSNICAAMEADNVLLKKKGPLGVFSHDPKPDIAGWTPMQPRDKMDLEDELKRYGLTLGQLQYIVSRTPIKWNPMSFNVEELKTKETVRQGIDGICDRFGYPAELMSGKNATYENRRSAEKFLYQTVIIPFAIRRMARYNQYFGFEDEVLYMDYNHLPVLQEDILHAGQAAYALSQAVDMNWKNGFLTYNQVMQQLDLEELEGMDEVYYEDWLKSNPIAKEIVSQPKQIANGTPSKTTGKESAK